MGKKAPKASRKLAAKGEIKRQIQERHKHQRLKRRVDGRKIQRSEKSLKERGNGKGNSKSKENEEDHSESVDGQENNEPDAKFQGMSVDDILGAGFMNAEDGSDQVSPSDDSDGEDSEDDGNASFASVDELSDEGETHLHELSQLAQKDPDFYKYLQENDRELLDFDPNSAGQDVDMEGGEDEGPDVDGEVEEIPILTKDILKSWQKALLEQRSLRALRKLLVAFRSAAHIQEESDSKVELAWRIDSPAVFRKLVTTALRYTPVILDHHIPFKTLPNGKFKQPATSKKFTGLTKLLLSHFHNVVHVISTLPQHSSSIDENGDGRDIEMTVLALSESAKLLPYIIGSKKAVKVYLKSCLSLWSSAQDNVRMAAFLAIRRLASSSDQSMLDLVLKGTYLTLVRSSKATSLHTLPSITLMKNSASELYCAPEHGGAYQHAFGYIRQLAILLRGGLKAMTKESYKQVYNWQFVHCVDFWTLVLARACSRDAPQATGRDSELQALIYPLVQVSLGAIQLIPTPRSYPFHLHLLRALLHLSRHTTTFIPLIPHLLPILQYSLSPSTSGKTSSLRPLPLDASIRAPAPYLRTRIYAETLADESIYVLAEWMGTPQVQGSIAFPEICVPIGLMLKKSIKSAKGVKQAAAVKMLVERMEEGSKWIEERRRGVTFAPAESNAVRDWQEEVRLKLGDTPVGRALKLLRKAREKRVKLLEKARDGEDEILDT